MFWKNVKKYNPRLSITGRLSVLYILSSLAMLVAFSLYSYWSLQNILRDADEQFLTDEIRVLRSLMVKLPSDKTALAQEIDWIPEEMQSSEYHYYARILTKNKHKVMETEGMANGLKDANFPEPVNADSLPDQSITWQSPNGKKYLLMTASSWLGKDKKEQRLIEIALDISPQQKTLAEYRKNLFLVFILGVIVAAGFGVFVAKRGMRALKEITQTTERITIDELHRTINIKEWPTELQSLAKAYNKMLSRIEQAIKRLSHFSSELAHELRTPINNLMGEAEIVLSRNRDVSDYKAVIESSLEEYSRLLHLIENILFLARNENPQSKLNLTQINLAQEFATLADYYDILANEKNINITYSGENSVTADPILFRRAVSNLLSNAIKFTDVGGNIMLNASQEMHKLVIIVQDSGVGIPPEHIDKIFDRFYRVEHSRSSSSGGTGLGLAIVKSIMDLHAGSVSVVSQLGQGTVARLYFPIY